MDKVPAATPGGGVVDTHVHVWRRADGDVGWLDDSPWASLRRDFSSADLRTELDRAGIGSAVLVQAATKVAETRRLLALAAGEPWIAGVVGWVSLRDPAVTTRQLDELEAAGAADKLVGIRHMSGWEPDGTLVLDGQAGPGAAVLRERGLALDVHVNAPEEIAAVTRLAAALPGLRIVLNHLGKPPYVPGPAAVGRQWHERIAELARHPDVTVKFSGWTTPARPVVTAGQVSGYLGYVVERFGSRRVLFGSNWPVTLVSCDYAQTWRESLLALGELTDVARRRILGENAMAVYRLGVATAAARAPAGEEAR